MKTMSKDEWKRLDEEERRISSRLHQIYAKMWYVNRGVTVSHDLDAARRYLKVSIAEEVKMGGIFKQCLFDHMWVLKCRGVCVGIVGEPYYFDLDSMRACIAFCEKYKLDCMKHAWLPALHYPGHTIALVFTQRKRSLVIGGHRLSLAWEHNDALGMIKANRKTVK